MRSEFTELLFDTDLLERAAARIEKRLESDRDNLDLLTHLAEICRKLGWLDKAVAAYCRVFELDGQDFRAGYISSLLSGHPASPWPDGDKFKPPPFTMIRNYLSTDALNEMLSLVSSIESAFTPSTVYSGYLPEVSRSSVFYIRDEMYESFKAELVGCLPEICGILGVDQFNPGYVSIEIKAYRHENYFRPHSDRYTGGHRRINFGCVFYFEPKRFSGGDFLLFDTDFEGQNYLPTKFTRIVSENNTAIFYPSDSYHSVMPVKTDGTDFRDCRFAIVGHIEEDV